MPPGLSKARVSDFKAPCPPLPCPLSLLLLLLGSWAPGSQGLCAQHCSDSAQCVRATGTACGIPGGSQLTQPGKPHEIFTPPQGVAGMLPRGSTAVLSTVGLLLSKSLSFISAGNFKLLLETGSQRAWGSSVKLGCLARIPGIPLPPPLQHWLGPPQALAAASFLHSCWRFELTSSF